MKKLISLCLVCVMVMTLVFSASAVTLEDLKAGETDALSTTYDNSKEGVYNSTSIVSQYATPTLDGGKDDCYSVTSAMEANYSASGYFTNDTDGNSATLYSANDDEYLYLLLETKQNVAPSNSDQIVLGVDFINTDNNAYINIGNSEYKKNVGFTDAWENPTENFSYNGGIIFGKPNVAPYKDNKYKYESNENGEATVEALSSTSSWFVSDATEGKASPLSNNIDLAVTVINESTTTKYGYVIEVRIPLPEDSRNNVAENIANGKDVVIGLYFRYMVADAKGTNDIGYLDIERDTYVNGKTGNLKFPNAANTKLKDLMRGYPAYRDVVISGKPDTNTNTSTKIAAAQSTGVKDGKYSIRFLAALNTADLANEKIGFDITYNDKIINKPCNTVYNQISANYGAKKYNALQLEGDYIFALEVTDLNTTETYSFTVATYHYADGNKVIDYTDVFCVSYDASTGVTISLFAE